MIVKLKKGSGLWNYKVYLYSQGNGKILNISEGYYSHWNAKRAARRVYPDFEKFDIHGDKFS